MDFKGLSRFGLDPFPIDIGNVLFEEGRVAELVKVVSILGKSGPPLKK